MANGRGLHKKGAVTVKGAWFAMPLEFLRSRACAELSPHAVKMLFDLCSSLGPNASGNGDLSVAPSIMLPRGWTSDATRMAAVQELLRADLLCVTRMGNRRQCALYAVTLWPLQCDLSKLEHGPGAFATDDWTKTSVDRAERPTSDAPARWSRPRKNEMSVPAAGQLTRVMRPRREYRASLVRSFDPATGATGTNSSVAVLPPRDTSLDSHLDVVTAGAEASFAAGERDAATDAAARAFVDSLMCDPQEVS